MSQTSVLEYLNQHKGKFYSTGEIAKHLGLNQNTIALNMRSLIKWRLVITQRFNSKEYYGVE
jgi:DNA-binding MarR family transcriptional regulator